MVTGRPGRHSLTSLFFIKCAFSVFYSSSIVLIESAPISSYLADGHRNTTFKPSAPRSQLPGRFLPSTASDIRDICLSRLSWAGKGPY